MIRISGYHGQKVGILGLGRTGLAAARMLRESEAEPWLWDDSPRAREAAESAGFSVVDFSVSEKLQQLSALIVSPGIPHLYPEPHPIIAAAQGALIPVDNDIGLFFARLGGAEWEKFDRIPRIIAVTGSNGKSTTSALLHHILNASGLNAKLAGNIGVSVLDTAPLQDGEIMVMELSSYQIELARMLTPDIAIFTNLSPDHLDRHGGMGGYFQAKARLFFQGGPDRAIIGTDEKEGQYLAAALAVSQGDDRVIRITNQKNSGFGWQISTRKGWLSEWRKGRQIASIDLRDIPSLAGAHNHQNAACAYAACRSLGLAPEKIAEAFKSFSGLPHRSQLILEHNQIRFINDSKATNVESAAKALSAHGSIRWICGGLMKEGGIEGLKDTLGSVKKAYVIGREAENFATSLAPLEAMVCTEMDIAVRAAIQDAEPGDTILLAPAAASFDQYDNFEKRGDAFVEAVKRYAGE